MTCALIKGDDEQDAVILFRDVTAGREMELMRSDFVSGIVKDLTAPVASIRRAVAEMQHPRVSLDRESLSGHIQTVEEEAGRLERRIAELLDVSRMEGQSVVPTLEPVFLEKMVEEITAIFRDSDPRHTYRVYSSTSSQAHADPVQIEYVIGHLMRNAVRNTPQGGVIKVDVSETLDCVRMSVDDAGAEMTPEEREKVMALLSRNEGEERQPVGLGLMGLFIARRIMEAHRGSLTAEPLPVWGMRFTMSLPKFTPARG